MSLYNDPTPKSDLERLTKHASSYKKWIVGFISLFVSMIFLTLIIGINDNGYRTVIQLPTGKTSVKFDAGIYFSWFGKTWEYPDYLTYDFSAEDNSCDFTEKDGISVQYQDGGKGVICGLARIKLPTDETLMLDIHRAYRGVEGIRYKMLNQNIPKAINMTAALMTSNESYATKRSQFLQLAYQQTRNGILQTKLDTKEIVAGIDEDGKEETQIKEVPVLVMGTDGKPVVDEESVFNKFSIELEQFDIKQQDYEPKTMAQITQKREAEMKTVTAKANAKKAYWEKEQVIADGKRRVSEAEYKEKQEAIKQVVIADRNKKVAEITASQKVAVAKLQVEEQKQLDLAAIEEAKRIKRMGDAEAHAKKVVMLADGALKQKLDAWLEAQKHYATAISKQKWVPEVQMGGAGGSSDSNAGNELLQMLSVQAAKQLSLDMKMKSK